MKFNRAIVERCYPSVIGMVFVFVAIMLLRSALFSGWRDVVVKGCITLMPSALNVSAIAVGFLATSLTLILSLGNGDVVRMLKKGGHFRRLLRFFGDAITVSFVWALVSAWITTFDLRKGGVFRYGALSAWAYLCACSILCYYRASSILMHVLCLQDNGDDFEQAPEWNDPEPASISPIDVIVDETQRADGSHE